MDDDLRWGLIYAHNRANANTGELETLAATVEALVELLVEAGLDPERLDAVRAEAAERVRRRFKERGMATIRQEFDVPKREWTGGVEIDCEARIPLCHAACCRLGVGLSTEDVREGILRWDPPSRTRSSAATTAGASTWSAAPAAARSTTPAPSPAAPSTAARTAASGWISRADPQPRR